MQWIKPVVFALAFACFGSHATAQILIGEVDAFGTLTDALGEEEDWVEVWNAGDQAASLEGLFLSDDGADWGKWPLPAVTLAPDERLVVFASGRDVRPLDHWEGTVRDVDLWRYHIPQAPLTSDWRRPEFNDAGWDVAPGGFGTCDELFEFMTLQQTGKRRDTPIVLLGSDYWKRIVNWQALADFGTVSDRDVTRIKFADTAEEAFEMLKAAIIEMECSAESAEIFSYDW